MASGLSLSEVMALTPEQTDVILSAKHDAEQSAIAVAQREAAPDGP